MHEAVYQDHVRTRMTRHHKIPAMLLMLAMGRNVKDYDEITDKGKYDMFYL